MRLFAALAVAATIVAIPTIAKSEVSLATNLLRTFAVHVEALRRYRGKPPTMTEEHVPAHPARSKVAEALSAGRH